MALGLLRAGARSGWSGHEDPSRDWERRVRVGEFPEIRVLPDVVDEGLGQKSGEGLDEFLWEWAGSFLLLEAGIVTRRVMSVLLGRGGTSGREERLHVVISCYRRKAGPTFLGIRCARRVP